MDIVHGKDLHYEELGLKHRGSGLAFKHLFLGEENTPENYLFSIARQGAFYSPIHRHTFDQFRYAYRGDVSIAPDLLLREGELCYHPEGVSYGPQLDEGGERDVLVLQFGGTSGKGYLSFAQIAEGQEKLKEDGRFEKGKFHPAGGGESKDSYEALWESYSGHPLEYPAARYHSVIVSKPDNYSWVPSDGSGNAFARTLGIFTERQTKADMIKIGAQGKIGIDEQNAIQLLFVLKGQGRANGTSLEIESAVRLMPDTGVSLSSEYGMELLRFVLPILERDIGK
ncbi:hypothetical protein N7448_005629 [Penicillium atrosanguineum]|uniref:Cupin domain-containing protein n=1 Tax=Penicillium atrosanguineum TaxID=1132637 RepID=A0A9W9H3X5_9EURO|nr:uncharacterized protein N7443_009369 [Penicillium atrosanguineum]KAJ5137075.1 hypothetical protein N7448_005629 [Penicillium atrosanguineum]KAJ5293416.1 hypothetical protein N7443_009369 [Penicillium atrosanguineum]KAJ5302551.1 hypothetical protein N7476_009350 [Penicillium atrosanguineum]